MANRRRAWLVAASATLIGSLLGLASPAQAADDDLSVVITGLTPSSLGDRGTLSLSGEITNDGDDPWTAVQAYMVIRPVPLTSRDELREAVETDRGFAGPRIIEPGSFDELGTLAPGSTGEFRIEIPVGDLPISGEDGVYPLGVQVLGTDPDGNRSNQAAARATTFLPHLDDSSESAPTTVVWPLLMPTARDADGRIADPEALLTSIGPEGRLHRLLDAALATDATGRGVVLDPALVEAVADLADGRSTTEQLDDTQRALAQSFLTSLVELGQSPSTWIVDYDRADVLALAGDASTRRLLFGAVERATDSVVATHSLSRARVAWPTRGSLTEGLAQALRERGEDPAVVSSQQFSDWNPSDGVLLQHSTSRGDLPLLVDDDVTLGVPGAITSTTLRQRVLTSAALAALDGGEALVLVDPRFTPDAAPGFSADYLTPRALADVPLAGRSTARLPSRTDTDPLDADQVRAADSAADRADLIGTLALDSSAAAATQAVRLADVLGVRWRSDRQAGVAAAQALDRSLARELSSVEIDAPPSVTLSSSTGAFPLTISNATDRDVSVGVQLDSSNPALQLDELEPVEVAAGERQTVTVEVDLEQQNATTVTARLVSDDGRTFGGSQEFIVKSSRVGAVLWWTMGAAMVFVLFALLRRFRARRGRIDPVPLADDDE